MWDFCTYFDSNYLASGITLYGSLLDHCGDFRLHILCLDEECYSTLEALDLPHVSLTRLDELESDDPELRAAKDDRRPVEYYFTLTSVFPRYLLEVEDLARITHLGADLYFFYPVERLMNIIGDSSIAVHTHRYPSGRDDLERYGRYNADFISFRADDTGVRCLEEYRENCLEWCYDRVEDGKFANQRYLDAWPDRYDDVAVVDHPGVGLAYWNRETHALSLTDGEVRVDGEPLIFYHFSKLMRVGDHAFKPPIKDLSDIERHEIYAPYVKRRLAVEEYVERRTGAQLVDRSFRFKSTSLDAMRIKQAGRTMLEFVRTLRRRLRGDLIVVHEFDAANAGLGDLAERSASSVSTGGSG